MRQRHGNCENLPAKAGVPAQDRLGVAGLMQPCARQDSSIFLVAMGQYVVNGLDRMTVTP
jgi:hypothetical protein